MLIGRVLREKDTDSEASANGGSSVDGRAVHTQLPDRCSTAEDIHHSPSYTVCSQVLMWSQFKSMAVDDASAIWGTGRVKTDKR